MILSPAQNTTLKNDIAANTGTIAAGKAYTGAYAGVQVKNVPNTGDGRVAIAGYYNEIASPDFWVWRSSVTRAEVYHKPGPDGTVWVWGTYKTQSVTEHDTWTQMFMGDAAPAALLTFRAGVFEIFGGGTGVASGKQRVHVLGTCRRQSTRTEKLFASAVVAVGTGGNQVSPSVDNGNVLADALGATTNPALLVVEGVLTADNVEAALSV